MIPVRNLGLAEHLMFLVLKGSVMLRNLFEYWRYPFRYYGVRCWFSHKVLRQPMDFMDVECINCSMPIGAVELHEEYPMAICQMCNKYTTVSQVVAELKECGAW